MKVTYILDAGPLFDYLMAVYWGSGRSGNWASLQFINTPVRMQEFSHFLRAAQPVATVSGVVVEISGLFQKREKKKWLYGQTGFWQCVWPLIGGANRAIGDIGQSLGDLGVEVVKEVGPVDASLLDLATKIRGRMNETAVIVSGDQEFINRCQWSVSTLHIEQVLEGRWRGDR